MIGIVRRGQRFDDNLGITGVIGQHCVDGCIGTGLIDGVVRVETAHVGDIADSRLGGVGQGDIVAYCPGVNVEGNVVVYLEAVPVGGAQSPEGVSRAGVAEDRVGHLGCSIPVQSGGTADGQPPAFGRCPGQEIIYAQVEPGAESVGISHQARSLAVQPTEKAERPGAPCNDSG